MNQLLDKYGIKGENTMVVGHLTLEIQAGVIWVLYNEQIMLMQYQKQLHIRMVPT